jgi:hypothetical protein
MKVLSDFAVAFLTAESQSTRKAGIFNVLAPKNPASSFSNPRGFPTFALRI